MAETKPLKIIHCFRSPIGGIFRHVRDLVEEHVKAGHQVGILCDSSTGGVHEERLFAAIEPHLALGLIRLPIRRSISPTDLAALYASYKHIKSLQPDVLHGHGAKGGVVARLIGSLLRVNRYCVARLYSPHGGSLHYDRAKPAGQIVLRLERFLERFCDQLVFVCDYERCTYSQKVGAPRIPSQVVYNGITEAEFAPVALAPDASDFLYIGMMRDLKGPDVFIDAFMATEKALGRRLSATMVGDGPDKQRYRAMLTDKGLNDRVALLDSMPARDAFALARTIIVPSRAEAMPYIVLEALAAEKPVIASRVGGIPEVLGTDSAALAIPGDPADLSRLMLDVLQAPDWQARVMPRPEAFKTGFSSAAMAQQMLDLYQGLVIGQGSKIS